LLAIGYKLFAIILLDRLRKAGAEQRLWPTQFGFRSQRGTRDAILLARRAIEQAWELKDGKVILLALDWAKAFDSVSPAGLIESLRRFGIPAPFRDMISSIYTDRRFIVKDAGETSSWYNQSYGICQGCPLSPFLFIILMTVLMHDAKTSAASKDDHVFASPLGVDEVVYADDTLLIGVESKAVETFMGTIGEAGKALGLSFNWSKLEALSVKTSAKIRRPDNGFVAEKQSLVYPGSALDGSGRIAPELGRRLGMAQSDFRSLARVWAHSTLSRAQKCRIFDACVVSKLCYSFEVASLNVSERRRLDGFQARCLRRICKIPPAFISRVSNATVLCIADQLALSTTLSRQQLSYFEQLIRRPNDDPVRCAIFKPSSTEPKDLQGTRRVGRPRTTWANTVLNQHGSEA
jgi:hypothetical protein